ncbi:hypothetical protein [Prevotella sp. tf2-5]|uniref:hypothetical protein n=1 Tax=Prevotella sp. tf2-5 TaxID=1761889 RepID=UPI0008EE1ED3|nr:hypothetical protein [Prevotella sp. tf2-5]SFO67825.1 hypothetical protein SAMN04487852_10518 [Prevotella sp. tf2-5]
MMENYVFISDLFRQQLLQFCSEDFITNNISWQGFHVNRIENHPISIIDVSSFIRDNTYMDILTKVRFCLAWLQAITANVQNPHNGIVFFEGMGYTSIRFTDFLCHLTNSGIITREEHMQLTNEWGDITNGLPYYQ